MRALILCELFPLVHGTRALQMAKVARALVEHTSRPGSGDEVFLVSGADRTRESEARDWLGGGSERRACLTYLPSRKPSGVIARAVQDLGTAAAKLTRNTPFVRRARNLAREIVGTFAPDVVMTVSTPLLWHRVGLALKKDFPTLPWAAFFADPRPLGLLPPPFRARTPVTAYKGWLCRRILARADAVLGPNEYMLHWMEERLGVSLDGRKYVMPHCGFPGAPAANAHGYRGWLMHVGSLHSGQVTLDLLKAIKRTAQKQPHEFQGLLCVGRVADSVHKLVGALGMQQYVKTIGTVPPETAASLVASADVLLLADTPLEIGYFLHSKFAEYAVSGRPILVVGPERCPMRDYLETHGGGLAVAHRQADIELALQRLFVKRDLPCQQNATRPLGGLTELGRQFAPETIATRYVRAFQEITNETGQLRRSAA